MSSAPRSAVYAPETSAQQRHDQPMPDDLEKDEASRASPQRKAEGAHTEPLGEADAAAAGGGVNYRTLTWWQGGFLIVAETVSLGVLGLPRVLATLGLAPGVVLIVGLGVLTTYTGYVFGQFKNAYPQVHNVSDVGYVLLGRWGQWVFEFVQVVYLIFIAGSHLLTFTIAFNEITGGATCTIAWSVVGLVVFVAGTLPRTLRNVSWLAAAAFVSLLTAVLITMIALGASSSGPAPSVQATVQGVAFAEAFGSTATIVFAYAGHVTFFSIISEFKEPRDFPKALLLLQGTATLIYTVVAVVIYVYAGAGVASPALGSTSPVVSKVAYGIALVTIVAAGVVPAHVNAKNVFVRMFRNRPDMLHSRSFTAWATWIAIVVSLWILSWIIAESIPGFSNLLSLIASLFGSWFSYGIAGILWLYLNFDGFHLRPATRGLGANGSGKGRAPVQTQPGWTTRKALLTAGNIVIVAIGAGIMGMGLYASGEEISQESGAGSWSCSGS